MSDQDKKPTVPPPPPPPPPTPPPARLVKGDVDKPKPEVSIVKK